MLSTRTDEMTASTPVSREDRKIKLEIKDMTKRYDNGDGVSTSTWKFMKGKSSPFWDRPDAENPPSCVPLEASWT